MDSAVFISHRPYTKQGVLDGLKRKPATASGKLYRSALRFCGGAFLLCSVISAVFLFAAPDKSQLPLIAANIAVTLGAGLLFWNLERLKAMRDYKTLRSLHGTDELIYVMSFTQEDVTITLGSQNSTYPYGSFGDITEDEDSFHLWLEKGLTYRIPKDSFVKGSAEHFVDFIAPRLGELQNGSFGRSRSIMAYLLIAATIFYVYFLFL